MQEVTFQDDEFVVKFTKFASELLGCENNQEEKVMNRLYHEKTPYYYARIREIRYYPDAIGVFMC